MAQSYQRSSEFKTIFESGDVATLRQVASDLDKLWKLYVCLELGYNLRQIQAQCVQQRFRATHRYIRPFPFEGSLLYQAVDMVGDTTITQDSSRSQALDNVCNRLPVLLNDSNSTHFFPTISMNLQHMQEEVKKFLNETELVQVGFWTFQLTPAAGYQPEPRDYPCEDDEDALVTFNVLFHRTEHTHSKSYKEFTEDEQLGKSKAYQEQASSLEAYADELYAYLVHIAKFLTRVSHPCCTSYGTSVYGTVSNGASNHRANRKHDDDCPTQLYLPPQTHWYRNLLTNFHLI